MRKILLALMIVAAGYAQVPAQGITYPPASDPWWKTATGRTAKNTITIEFWWMPAYGDVWGFPIYLQSPERVATVQEP